MHYRLPSLWHIMFYRGARDSRKHIHDVKDHFPGMGFVPEHASSFTKGQQELLLQYQLAEEHEGTALGDHHRKRSEFTNRLRLQGSMKMRQSPSKYCPEHPLLEPQPAPAPLGVCYSLKLRLTTNIVLLT